MATLSLFCGFLNEHNYRTKLTTPYGAKMKDIFVKATHHIFKQLKKDGVVTLDDKFDINVVVAPGIEDNNRYYGVISLVTIISENFARAARQTSKADATHFQVIGQQSYGTIFQVSNFYTDNHITRLLF